MLFKNSLSTERIGCRFYSGVIFNLIVRLVTHLIEKGNNEPICTKGVGDSYLSTYTKR